MQNLSKKMKSKLHIVLIAIFAAILAWYACNTEGGKAAIPDTVSYNFHVRPILSDKCFACHGPDKNKRKAEFRLDIEEFAFAPLKETKGAFAIVRGKPEESELYKRIISKDRDYQMPSPDSHLGLLTEIEIQTLEKWIKQGAKYEKHWAFIKPEKTVLPKIKDKKWAKNEIDYFTQAKMSEHGLSPNDAADKEYLLKRAAIDVTGLLPQLELIDQYNADKSENAYENALDKLMATPQYGEKMAVYWLDVARYADSYGYQDDNIRTQWAWRDWVIHAFNKNLPYDQFLTWQLAGDMLPDSNKEHILATAFLRNHKYTEEGGIIPEEYRIEYNLDKTKTFSKGILGLTAECAQCHDHKYDPISQKEYYQLFAFFNNSKESGFEGAVDASKPAKNPVMKLSDKEIKDVLTFINKKDTGSLMVSVMGELNGKLDKPRTTYILKRGVYDQHGDSVKASALGAVLPFDTTKLPRNRLGLAQWTVDKNNPLTARVFVNQIWQEFFGVGLVKSTGDFGMQGNLPTHPELLDWLAVDFMEHNWDIKRLVKQILTSATYRQSAKLTDKHLAVDPDNVYLSRYPRTRVKAEFVRDIVLGSSGLLVKDIGGPSVKPYQPKGLWERATSGRGVLAKYETDEGDALYRRGMYTFIKLTVPPPSMILFDASNRDQCEVKRSRTNTPLQALIMLNDPSVLEASRVFAQRLTGEQTAVGEKIDKAFRTIICRQPSHKETTILTDYFNEQLTLFKNNKLDAEKTLSIGASPINKTVDLAMSAALMKVVSTIYNMDEAITKT
jgi:Protein of unknown function (DUF1553)/Protein of unknown function (DUF1549)/Planctomycete cytochrome C